MSLYTKDSIDRLKDSVDMVELVGAKTDLRRVGTRFTGLCPFHDERTPSFSVNAEHKLFHCFGCGESGDAIRFVQETEGLDFKQAIEALAERYNVELKREHEDPAAERRRERRERLLKLVQRATDYYARYLWEAGEAKLAREGPQQAKYINTAENELYHKGRQLFGIDLARVPAAKRGRILVVEGYTDVLALHQAGLSETVAIMGTAVTPEQVTLLSQTVNSVF